MTPLNDYITISDVKNVKILQLYQADDTFITSFIADVNNAYEALAANLDVNKLDIAFPITQNVKDLLLADLEIRVGGALIGGTESSVNENSVYQTIYNLGRANYDRLIPRINALAITGEESRSADTVIFGRVVRR